jgi:hypothetical protein
MAKTLSLRAERNRIAICDGEAIQSYKQEWIASSPSAIENNRLRSSQ